MHYAGIDLHKRFLVVGIEDDEGRAKRPIRLECHEVARIVSHFEALRPFRCVIEASSSYRWLYELLEPLGEVKLAHPYRLRAIVAARAKTDKLDAALLAKLLRADLIPSAHVPAKPYSDLRDLTRARARVVRLKVKAKNELHALLARSNVRIPYVNIFCKSGRRWIAGVDLGWAGNVARDELLDRLCHFENAVGRYDARLAELEDSFPHGSISGGQVSAAGGAGEGGRWLRNRRNLRGEERFESRQPGGFRKPCCHGVMRVHQRGKDLPAGDRGGPFDIKAPGRSPGPSSDRSG